MKTTLKRRQRPRRRLSEWQWALLVVAAAVMMGVLSVIVARADFEYGSFAYGEIYPESVVLPTPTPTVEQALADPVEFWVY